VDARADETRRGVGFIGRARRSRPGLVDGVTTLKTMSDHLYPAFHSSYAVLRRLPLSGEQAIRTGPLGAELARAPSRQAE